MKPYQTLVLTLVCCRVLFGHGGRLDSNGGHRDSSTGTYHYHGGGGSAGGGYDSTAVMLDLQRAEMAAAQARYFANLKARNEERRDARDSQYSARVSARRDAKAQRPDPKYIFHHRKQLPLSVLSFEDRDAMWETILTSSAKHPLKKELVIRIEPVGDPTDWRTWIDSTGKYSTVAKYSQMNDTLVELVTIRGDRITVKISKLSHVDQEHLEKIAESKA